MDRQKWDDAERRRAEKFNEIKQLLAETLGPNADLEEEALDAIDEWENTVEMEDAPIAATTPLQRLLREYHYICEEILDLDEDD